MVVHKDSKFVPFHAAQMFDLVVDIASYPEFLPWCKAARIRSDQEEGEERLIEADLVIAFAAFQEKFGSLVRANASDNRISVRNLDGPFRKLDFEWTFLPRSDGTDVQFGVDFEFKSRILQMAIGQVFDMAMGRVVGAFEARAHALYEPITKA